MTPCAAKWAACWLEPHCRSIVVAGTDHRPSCREHALPADVKGLLADLGDAAGDDVVDPRRVHAGALGEGRQHGGEQLDGVGAR